MIGVKFILVLLFIRHKKATRHLHKHHVCPASSTYNMFHVTIHAAHFVIIDICHSCKPYLIGSILLHTSTIILSLEQRKSLILLMSDELYFSNEW